MLLYVDLRNTSLKFEGDFMKKLILALSLMSVFCFATDSGFKVNDIEASSLYSKMTIKKGDVIMKINGNNIKELNDLMKYMSKPNTIKTLLIIRNEKEKIIKL